MTIAEGLPEAVELGRVLAGLVAGPGGRLTVAGRRANPYSSTYPSEIVTCLVDAPGADGAARSVQRLRVLCKYEPTPTDRIGFVGGLGLAHEAFVNEQVAAPSGLTLPHLYGLHRDPSSGWTWLVFSYIEGLRLSKVPGPGSLAAGATWIGRFQAYWDQRTDHPAVATLPRLDAARLQDQLDRAVEFLGTSPPNLQDRTRWLVDRWAGISAAVGDRLLSARPTVVHGEFYADNILLAGGEVFPVDWESAALAPGELDLATLTDAWDATSVALAERAYASTRYGDSDAPAAERLDAARLFVQLHWLATGFDWGDPSEWRILDEARRASIALGVG